MPHQIPTWEPLAGDFTMRYRVEMVVMRPASLSPPLNWNDLAGVALPHMDAVAIRMASPAGDRDQWPESVSEAVPFES